ncbi:MAG: hypothetical protein EOP38_10540 [Rubrivivax sp.]|nr:MAG: hypothetical protein EOP38_10540 [Rubrivivax sp.]
MIKTAMAAGLLGLACCVGVAQAAQPSTVAAASSHHAETELRQAMQEALWPADIVRLSGDYLRQYPGGNWADAARALHERASTSAQVLGRKDVRLYRTAFQPTLAAPELKDEIRKAALGDQDAAIRLARGQQINDDGADVATANSRYVGWLQYAAMLGHQQAAYELALHFRKQDQPVLASQYEARAVALGYTPPTVLDHVRK